MLSIDSSSNETPRSTACPEERADNPQGQGSTVKEIPEGLTGDRGQAHSRSRRKPHMARAAPTGREEVGRIREELHVCIVFLNPLHVRTDEGNLIEDRFPVESG